MTFNEIIEEVLLWEGGYVNDPDDLGGETKYGITKRRYPHLNIKDLTKGQAVAIYKEEYWDEYNLSKFPEEYRHIYFDMVINMGPRGAGLALQWAINNKAGRKVVEEDGIAGPITRQYLKSFRPEIERVRAFRLLRYADITRSRPANEKFFYGWYRRAVRV